MNFGTDGTPLTATGNNFSGGSTGSNRLLEVYFATANGTAFNIVSEIYNSPTPVGYPYFTNASLTQTDDAYSFQASNTSGTKYRIRNRVATADPGTQNIGFGSLVNLTGTAVSATQTTGLSYTPDQTSLNGSPVFRAFQIDLDQSASGGAHWQIKISAGWLGSTTTYAHPALSSISGFNTNWDISSGTSTNATVSTATTQSGRGGLSLVIRKTMGRNSNNLGSWVVAQKLATNDRLRMDIARQFSNFSW